MNMRANGTVTKQAASRRGRKGLIVDNGFLGQFGLDQHVDTVMERLRAQNKDFYASTKNWRDEMTFESELSQAPHLAQLNVRGDVALAVMRTWRPDPKYDDLAMRISEYDDVYAIRIGPIALVMLTWLSQYQNMWDNFVQGMEELHKKSAVNNIKGRKNQAALNPVTSKQVQAVTDTIAEFKDARSFELLDSSLDLGFNRNVLKPMNVGLPQGSSNLLYSFNQKRADRLSRNGLHSKAKENISFRQSIRNDVTLHVLDYSNPATQSIFSAMTRICKLKLTPSFDLVTNNDSH